MARKYINLFDENGNPVRVPLGADAENVDIESVNGLEADNVQEAIEELAGQQTTIEMDDVPTTGSNKAVKSGGVAAALAQKQDKLTSANAGNGINISEQGVISTVGGGGSDVSDLAGDCTELTVNLMVGYRINIEGGGLVSVPQNTNHRVSEPIALTGKAGKFLFFPGEKGTWGAMYRSFHYDGNNNAIVSSSPSAESWGDNPYVIIPISDENEYIQIKTQTYDSSIKVYFVTKRWLKNRGLCTDWAGKKWAMLGDSYVAGHNIGQRNTWYNVFALLHFANLTNMGENGIGLVRSPNIDHGILMELEDRLLDNGEPLDLDVIGICCGRNDSTTSVPIGTIDDMIELPDETNQYLHGDVTFMGGLNYLCSWLLDHYAGKRIFFITPWNFLNNAGGTAATPIEYVDAMKTIAGKWGIPCFDAARDSGISVQHEGFRSMYFLSTSDVSHLNIAGHRLMAHGPAAGWLENLFRD